MKIPVVMRPAFPRAALSIIENALNMLAMPAGWREAEYAMTKATGWVALASLSHQGDGPWTLDLFDWQVLQGEIARLYRHRRLPVPRQEAFALFAEIRGAILANPSAVEMDRRSEAIRDAEAAVEAAQEALAAANVRLAHAAADHQAARQDATTFYRDRPHIESAHAAPPE